MLFFFFFSQTGLMGEISLCNHVNFVNKNYDRQFADNLFSMTKTRQWWDDIDITITVTISTCNIVDGKACAVCCG